MNIGLIFIEMSYLKLGQTLSFLTQNEYPINTYHITSKTPFGYDLVAASLKSARYCYLTSFLFLLPLPPAPATSRDTFKVYFPWKKEVRFLGKLKRSGYSFFNLTPFSLKDILSDIRYITGTITRVKNVANIKPNITVQAMGPQKLALSPPT